MNKVHARVQHTIAVMGNSSWRDTTVVREQIRHELRDSGIGGPTKDEVFPTITWEELYAFNAAKDKLIKLLESKLMLAHYEHPQEARRLVEDIHKEAGI